jgi:RHS repeat-associated protein
VWQSVSTIASLGGSGVTNTGNMYVAKTPEVYTYDLDGNTLTDGRWSNTWDAENRLIIQETIGTVPAGAKKRLIHEYDWMGRRIRKQVYDWVASAWSLTQDQRFLYDGWNVVAILNSPSSILQTQLWGSDLSGTLQGAGGVGGLLALTHYPSAKTYFTGYDGNGNVTVLIDGVSGLTEGNFEYGPFGELIRASGTAVAVCPWRFSTKYEDAETGLLYYGYRFYNPSTGRWLSRDPIEERGGLSLYGFVENEPVSSADVLGAVGFPSFPSIPSFPWPNPLPRPNAPPVVLPSASEFFGRFCPFRCNGRPYNPLTHCCCEGRILTRSKIPTGIRICRANSPDLGVEHQWIEIDGWSAGFSGTGPGMLDYLYCPGVVNIPDGYSTRTDKQCEEVLASPCSVNISKLKEKIKADAEKSKENPPPYLLGVGDCRQWSDYNVYANLQNLRGEGCGN